MSERLRSRWRYTLVLRSCPVILRWEPSRCFPQEAMESQCTGDSRLMSILTVSWRVRQGMDKSTQTRSKETRMRTAGNSLQLLLKKWRAPTLVTPIRVTRFNRTDSNRRHYICVEGQRPEGSATRFFFWHNIGVWRMFLLEMSNLTILS